MLRFLIEKEFKQIIRNSFLPRMIIAFPCMVMLVFPWAANFEIKNINISIIDNDHSTYSQRLVNKITSSGYFRLTDFSENYSGSLKSIESGKTDIILEIQSGFEKDLVKEGTEQVMISANAVNGMKGGLGASYLSAILNDYAGEIRDEWFQSGKDVILPVIKINPYYRFNPHLDYKVFMVPALMVMLLTMICGFLPALNIVAEKEAGTIEQINVTPVSKFTFIMSKLLPYWIIGFLILSICFILAFWVYGLIPVGKLSTLYIFAGIYILVVSGCGLVISNYSATMQQAMFVMMFFIIVFLLMSGLFTPVSSMPEWAQVITIVNPLKYFIQVMRAVYLKGSGVVELLPQLLALCGFAVFFNLWAVVSYRKSM